MEGFPKSEVHQVWLVQREWDGTAFLTCVPDQEDHVHEEVVGRAPGGRACGRVVVHCSHHDLTSNGGQVEWGRVVLLPRVGGGVDGLEVGQEKENSYLGSDATDG